MALADPAGLFAVVAWTGGDPVPAFWWWSPYAVLTPLLLLLHFVATRCLAGAVVIHTPRAWLFLRIWLIVILSSGLAWFVNAVLVVVISMADRDYLLTLPATLSFLLWSSGYAMLKMACLGWLPAIPGLMLNPDASKLPGHASVVSNIVPLSVGLTLFMLVAVLPWLGNHWWSGSPVGALYQECPGLIAPVPVTDLPGSGIALLICLVTIWVHLRRSLARLACDAQPCAVFIAGAQAGAMAAFVLFVAQILVLVANGIITSDRNDYWFVTASGLLAVEASSFALVVAFCSGCAAWIGSGLQTRLGSTRPSTRTTLRRLGLVLAAAGGITMAGMVGTKHRVSRDSPVVPVRLPDAGSRLTAPLPMVPLTVRHDPDRAILANQYGSQVTLRGVNVNQLGEYDQQDVTLSATQPLTASDFSDIASLGLNSVRLTLSWSLLEPQRGHISQQYLDRIRQAVSWATDNRVYVILDMHQDAWSATVGAPPGSHCRAGTEPMKGWDGAPRWATRTDKAPACQFTGRDLAPNVSRAFQSFYVDRDGIQTELVHAWAVLAASFADNATVAGYDLFNEPNFAETPPVSSTLLLWNYYARAIAAIRNAEASAPHGYAHPVILEPSIFWSGFGVDNLPPAGFSHDPQLVYSPHLYNESITSDQDLGINLVSIERGFRLAQASANRLNAALWIGEWGFFGDSGQQWKSWLRQSQAEDKGQIGSALWVWKQGCGDPHVYPGKVAGNFVKATCPGNQPVETDPRVRQIMQRPYVRSAPGRLLQSGFNAGLYSFSGSTETTLGATGRPSCNLEVWLPGTKQPEWRGAQGVTNPVWQKIEPGTGLGASAGGWNLHACVVEPHYQLKISLAPW